MYYSIPDFFYVLQNSITLTSALTNKNKVIMKYLTLLISYQLDIQFLL